MSTRFSLSMETSGDRTAEPVSRDQKFRRGRGHGNIRFPCSADHVQDWQPYPVDPYSCCMCDHTYIGILWHVKKITYLLPRGKKACWELQGTHLSNQYYCRDYFHVKQDKAPALYLIYSMFVSGENVTSTEPQRVFTSAPTRANDENLQRPCLAPNSVFSFRL